MAFVSFENFSLQKQLIPFYKGWSHHHIQAFFTCQIFFSDIIVNVKSHLTSLWNLTNVGQFSLFKEPTSSKKNEEDKVRKNDKWYSKKIEEQVLTPNH